MYDLTDMYDLSYGVGVATPLTIRRSGSQAAAWALAAGREPVSSWARRVLDLAAAEHAFLADLDLPGGGEGVASESAPASPGSAAEPDPFVEDFTRAVTEGIEEPASAEAREVFLIRAPEDVVEAVGRVRASELKFVPDPKPSAAKKAAKKTAGGMCEHRVAAGAFCKRCEERENP